MMDSTNLCIFFTDDGRWTMRGYWFQLLYNVHIIDV